MWLVPRHCGETVMLDSQDWGRTQLTWLSSNFVGDEQY